MSTVTKLDVTRSSDFWFDDGTIVLEVENTQFRVHGGLLSFHSNKLAEMLKNSDPQNQGFSVACRVVSLEDDVEDWETMLMVIYQPMKVHPTFPRLSTIQLVSILRLGKKYQFDLIYNSAVTRLQSELGPRDLDQYHHIVEKLHLDKFQEDHDCYAMACSTWSLLELINIAVELNIEAVLPTAYYMASQRKFQIILEGSVDPDGFIVELSHRTQEIILLGRDRIRNAIMEKMFWWIFTEAESPVPSTVCQDSKVCLPVFCKNIKGIAYDAIAGVKDVFDDPPWKIDGLCPGCRTAVKAHHSATQSMIWAELPLYFGFKLRFLPTSILDG